MSVWCPPYINKHVKKLEKAVVVAESKFAKAKSEYEFAKEYLDLCKNQLAKAKDEDK